MLSLSKIPMRLPTRSKHIFTSVLFRAGMGIQYLAPVSYRRSYIEVVVEDVVDKVVDRVCNYYEHHTCLDIFYFRDRYGDSNQPNAKKSMPCNEQAIERFQKNGWKVFPRVHKGQERPQHEKYLLWSNILKGTNPAYPKVIFNGKNCKYTLISMNNTRVIEKDVKYKKDKASERMKTVFPEEASHFLWRRQTHLDQIRQPTILDFNV